MISTETRRTPLPSLLLLCTLVVATYARSWGELLMNESLTAATEIELAIVFCDTLCRPSGRLYQDSRWLRGVGCRHTHQRAAPYRAVSVRVGTRVLVRHRRLHSPAAARHVRHFSYTAFSRAALKRQIQKLNETSRRLASSRTDCNRRSCPIGANCNCASLHLFT